MDKGTGTGKRAKGDTEQRREIGEQSKRRAEREVGDDRRRYKVAFWNVAGLKNKNRVFWEGIKGWDVVIMCETWIGRKEWEGVRGRATGGYVWDIQYAERRGKKGRAMGGMIVGVREGIRMEKDEKERGEEGIIARKIWLGKDAWKVVGVYVNKDLERKLGMLREWMEEKERGVRIIIGGDFNARTGSQGGRIQKEGEGEEETRRSKDKKVNGEGKRLCEFLGDMGWEIMNGDTEGDEEGEFTYIGNGESVIDYVIGNEETREKVERVEVEGRVESDHQPVVVWIEGGKREGGNIRGKGKRGRRTKGRWTEEMKREFAEKFGRKEEKGKEIEEEWGELKREIMEVLERMEKKKGGKERKDWWDEECKEKKNWKEKKRRGKERWEKEIEGIRTEGEVWKIINRERKGGGRGEEGRGREEDEEKNISREEIGKAIKRLKEGKAPGGDGIPNEVWKFGGEVVRERIWEVCNRVWRGEGWPEDWSEGVVVPVVKKGEGRKVEEYRGVTLTQTAYRVYAAVLAERLIKEIEEKEIMPPNQTGFRKGMGTIDNIYVLNYLINRQVARKGGKMWVLFVDLKAAFDSVDREVLIESMRNAGVREGLVRRCGGGAKGNKG
ncbi:Transposon TX1 uncharacterized 149 kDa protein [Anthophora plagiata]